MATNRSLVSGYTVPMKRKNGVTHSYWLMKSEPSEYSIFDLKQARVGRWDGVRNYQVRNMMRDQMKKGDLALFYHSSTKDVGVVGEMQVTSAAYPDPTQFDKTDIRFDAHSTLENPRWLCVDVKFRRMFPQLVTLSALRSIQALQGMRILQKGNRLSITPVTEKEYEQIVTLGTQ